MTKEERIAFAIEHAGEVCRGYGSIGGNEYVGRLVAYDKEDGVVLIERPGSIRDYTLDGDWVVVCDDYLSGHVCKHGLEVVALSPEKRKLLEELKRDITSWEP